MSLSVFFPDFPDGLMCRQFSEPFKAGSLAYQAAQSISHESAEPLRPGLATKIRRTRGRSILESRPAIVQNQPAPPQPGITRLQPSQLPDQTARQLPEQSTTLRVEPSSTGDTRRRGALGNPGLKRFTNTPP